MTTSRLTVPRTSRQRRALAPLVLGVAASLAAYTAARSVRLPGWVEPVTAIAWLAGLAAVATLWVSPREAAQRARALLSDRQLVLHCAVLLGVALLLRVVFLDRLPANLGGDEFSQALEAKAFYEGRLHAVFGTSDWYAVPLFYPWLGSLLFRLLGPAPWVWRLLTGIAGSVTVPLLYLLVRAQFRGVALAISAAGLLAFHHVHVLFSRLGSNQGFDGLFVTAILLAIVVGRREFLAADSRARGLWWYVAGATAGLGFYFYFALRGIALLCLAIVAVLALFREAPRVRAVGWFLVGLALAVLPLIGGAERSGHDLNRRVGQVLVMPEGDASDVALELAARGSIALQSLQRVGLRGWYESGAGLLVTTLELVLLVVGTVIALRRIKDAGWIHPLILGAVIGSVALLTENPLMSQRVTSATVPAAVLVALGIDHLARLLWPQRRAGLALATVALIGGINVHHLFLDHMPRRSLDITGLVATELGNWLDDNPGVSRILFCGGPQMKWDSNASVRFRHPALVGAEIADSSAMTSGRAVPGTAYVVLSVCDELRYTLSLQPELIATELRYQKPEGAGALNVYLETGGRGHLRWLPDTSTEPYRPQEERLMTIFVPRPAAGE